MDNAKIVSVFDGMACGMLAVAEIVALVVMVRGWRRDKNG